MLAVAPKTKFDNRRNRADMGRSNAAPLRVTEMTVEAGIARRAIMWVSVEADSAAGERGDEFQAAQ